MKKSYSSPYFEVINSLKDEFCADSTVVVSGDQNAFLKDNMELDDDLE